MVNGMEEKGKKLIRELIKYSRIHNFVIVLIVLSSPTLCWMALSKESFHVFISFAELANCENTE